MRRKIMLGIAVGAVLVFGSAGGAFAGEYNANGEATGARSNANSPCAFSGLEDHETDGSGVTPGTTQNWGQFDQAARKAFSLHGGGASEVNIPGLGEWGCNGHTQGQK
ncbi:hypothetical protein J2X85_002460 [Microbacterium trichothecenolyticum]|uniref:hypothetical protein n=1 Tax=Microbacterium trichothecenolyticum TaxID=69370 RepID=UPI002863790C|nr:hypothetical protein [Microbacterium trichothecenolyticum]MDR7185426.1 hypothetical protein [Microbacterium trichothecenolyticum]